MTDPSLTARQTTEPVPQSLRDAEAAADALITQASESQNTVVTPQAAPVTTPTQAPVPTQVPVQQVPINTNQDRNFEAMYRSLKGKYDKEVHADVAALQAQYDSDRTMIHNLMDQVNRLTSALEKGQAPAAPAEPAANTQPLPGKLNPEDFTHYGEEIVSLVKVNNTLVDRLGQVDPNITARLDSLDSKFSANETMSFKTRLTELVPEWEGFNKDKGFIDWSVNNLAPFSSETMNALLNKHFKAGDLERTAEIFNSYKSHISTADPLINEYTLENQIVPDTTNAVLTPEGEKIPLVTEQELEAAAKRYQSNTTPQNEAEYERLYKLHMEQQNRQAA